MSRFHAMRRIVNRNTFLGTAMSAIVKTNCCENGRNMFSPNDFSHHMPGSILQIYRIRHLAYKFTMRLILKIVAGILLGMVIGSFAPGMGAEWLVRLMVTVQTMINELIVFVIPLIVFFFITSGISSLPDQAGKMLGKTVGISYLSTVLAASMAFWIASPLIPSLVGQELPPVPAGQRAFAPFLTLEIPPLMGVMTALALSFVFGLSIQKLKLVSIKSFADEGKSVVELFLGSVVIPLLPFYIAGEFAKLAAEGQAVRMLGTFFSVLCLAVCLHFLWLSVLYTLAGIKSGKPPWKILATMFPAYLTALGTMSSAATIPVTLRQAKKAGVPPHVADFTIPLCANIHLSGSAITISTCSLALMFLTNHHVPASFDAFLPFILVLGIVMVAAPGAPGGAVLSALGILQSMLHFSDAQCALMIALYIAQDSFGTACNVTGDGALSILVSPKNERAKQ